jgi:voltage-gated potassium channel
LLDGGPNPTRAARRLSWALAALIVLNVAAVVLATEPTIHDRAPGLFEAFEVVSVVIFSLEYLIRLRSAPENPRFAGRFGRLRWLLSPMALCDLLAVLPAFVAATTLDLRSLRIVRLVRIVRIARLGRYSAAVQTLVNVLRAKAADLLSLLLLLLILLVLSSTLMFHCEHEAQPETFSSIPMTMWWGIVTLTTVGYGDMAPVTGIGRALGAVIAVLGVGMYALPAGLLGAAFVDELGKVREARKHQASAGPGGRTATCPHCGRHLA